MSIMSQEAKKQNGCVLHWTGAVATSNSPKAITANGDVKQLLPFPGAGIGMFDGTGDYLQISDGDWVHALTSPHTIEIMVKISSNTTNQTFFNIGGTGTAWSDSNGHFILCQIDTSNLYYQTHLPSSQLNTVSIASTNIPTNQWVHLAFVYTGAYKYIFINGNLSASIACTKITMPTIHSTAYIARHTTLTSYCLNGNMSEFCISNVARYTANFTPPRRQLESDSNTKLLLHFNRNDTTFIDSSPSAHTITTYGDAKQLCSPCGSGVAYFDGTGDSLSTIDHADWDLVGVAYTISFWVYFNTVATDQFIIGQCPESSAFYNDGSWAFALVGGKINKIIKTGESGLTYGAYTALPSLSANTWYHFTLSVNTDGTGTVTQNADTGSVSGQSILYTSSLALSIGRASLTGQVPACVALNGYVSDIVIKKNVNDTNIATLITPFKPDPYTKLLLHMDGVGNAFYDSSDPPGDNGFPILPAGVTVTPSGTFTTQKMKDGRNVWKFDGSTNYITISDHASWSMFLNDFTIAGWVKFDSIAANKVIIGQYVDANNQWYLQWTTSNIIQLYGITSSTARFNFSCPLAAVANTWYHIVVQRSGSSCIMYINGVAQTVTQTTAFSATATDIAAVLSIGKINTGYQTGNIKDLQMFTKALTMDQISALYQETYIY